MIAPNKEEDQNKALHDLLLINCEEHLILGLVNISCLAYARENHRNNQVIQHKFVGTMSSAM